MSPKELFAYPANLATAVVSRLRRNGNKISKATIQELLEVAYFASMRTEESEPIRFSLVYIDLRYPDPDPPERIVADRWSVVRFEQPIAFNVANLVKISKSIDYSCASLAVYKQQDGRIVIWGAIDQQWQRNAFISRDSDSGPESPGEFQIEVSDVGAIEVFRDYHLLGALRNGRLLGGSNAVLFESGPIQDVLQIGIQKLIERVRKEQCEVFDRRGHWPSSIAGHWMQALTRILLGIQRYGHGGAVFLSPNEKCTGIQIKYPIQYNRLGEAVFRFSANCVEKCDADDILSNEFIDRDLDFLPVDLHLNQAVLENTHCELTNEVSGCVRFIASLSRVDGLIVMNTDLTVRGYGGFVTAKAEFPRLFAAGDSKGSRKRLTEIEPTHFGTRHQSMFRLCSTHPKGIGIVISQDGEVRAMTMVEERLVMWSDIKLRLDGREIED
jgi:hypothetical protein